MEKIIRIGTRDSQLALWQARKVARMLNELDYNTEIIPIKSKGDLVLDKPIYEIGITGVFTKSLDIALLNEEIDIAVHSMKDVPTTLPEGIKQVAVLKRANYNDILVLKNNEEFLAQPEGLIATGSLRRRAQWLNRYPTHKVEDLRGNINTRLEKLQNSNWDGAIFAAAGLERIGLRPKGAISLSWMLPAPAQGAIMVTSLERNLEIVKLCEEINDKDTELCTSIERDFLKILEGGCTAPIGALAIIKEVDNEIVFKGVLLSRDGKKKIEITKKAPIGKHFFLAKDAANYIIDKGGRQLITDDVEVAKKHYVYSTKSLSISQTNLVNNYIGVESSDFIKIRFNRIAPREIKKELKHVVITSKNGVESILNSFTKDELNFGNIYCVGRRTKRLIEQKLGKVTKQERNSERLAEYLINNLKEEEVTYFCSDLRLDILPNKLEEGGLKVHEIIAYKTIYSPTVVSENVGGVLFYSPSTVVSFIKENNTDKIAFCIGESTAKEASKYFKEVKVAKVPTVESVLDLVNLYYV